MGKLQRTSENEITVMIKNESDFELTYGGPFALEKNLNGTWYSLPFKMNVFGSRSYSLRPHESSAQTVSLDPYLENDLPPGKYRLVKFFGELFDSKQASEKIKSYLRFLLK